MRAPRLRLAMLVTALACAFPTLARAEPAEAGGYRVAFIRPGAGGYIHGFSTVARVGRLVLVGSPAEVSFADVYDPKTGARRHHLPALFGLDESSFGVAVAPSARGFLVGDPQPGEAYLFARRDARLLRTFRPPALVDAAGFGAAVAEVSDGVVVGAPSARGDSPLAAAGAAFLFDARTAGYEHEIVSPTSRTGGRFGSAVARCGRGIAIAEPGGYYEPGGVHVFDADGTWVQQLQAPEPAARDGFGSAIACAGSRLLIGAPGLGADGAAYLYERHRGRWRLAHTFTAPDATTGRFGTAVALADRRVAVGAAGAVFVFDLRERTLVATLRAPEVSDPELGVDYAPYLPWSGLGTSVAIVGGTIVVTTAGDDENAGSIVVGFARGAKRPPECGAPYPCP